MIEEQWLRIDERTDVTVSLSLCLSCLNDVHVDPALWKWAILSLHSALQGSMVCHLSGTASIGGLSDSSAREYLDWHEKDRRGEIKRIELGVDDETGIPSYEFASKEDEPPKPRLADAKTLFKRLYRKHKRREGAGGLITVDASQRQAFDRLHSLRNSFAHFAPRGWSIALDGLPDTFLSLLSVLDQISADPWPFRHMSSQEKDRHRRLLLGLRTQLGKL